jgi:hypothetical protein
MRQGLRSHLTFANVVSMIALSVGLGGTTYAATGGNFILGQPNSASSTTSLTRTGVNTGKGLQVTNASTDAGATALGLNVASGHSPFTVNSGTKVANLNADRLDGLDSTSFVPNSKVRRVGPIAGEPNPFTGFLELPIATVGPFTFTGLCSRGLPNPSDVFLQVAIESNVSHSTYGSLTHAQAGGEWDEPDMNAATKYSVARMGPGPFSGPFFHSASGIAVAPDGQQVTFDVYQAGGARSQANECMFGGTFVAK